MWAISAVAILWAIIFCYIPMLGNVIAFFDYTPGQSLVDCKFVGLKYWIDFFQLPDMGRVFRNTLVISGLSMTVGFVAPIVFALLLNEIHHTLFKKVVQTISYLPYFISWVVVGAFVYNLFNYEFGAVNTFLKSVGLDPVDIYSNKGAWPFILVAFSAFKNVGYGTVMYLASIVNIDDHLFEAAELDGANMWQKIRHITIPCIRPTIVILFLLAIGTIMKGDFQMFWQVTGNNPMVLETTDVIDTYVTRSLLTLQEFGMTSAAGLYQSGISFVLVLIANRLVKKVEPDYALF